MDRKAQATHVARRPVIDWHQLERTVFSPTAACAAAWLSLMVMLGCMNISIGGSSDSCSAVTGEFKQTGSVTLPAGAVKVVYYPVPFGSLPNLELDDANGTCEIIEQKEGYFRIRCREIAGGNTHTFGWTARGIHVPQVTPSPQTAVTTGGSVPPPANSVQPAVAIQQQHGN
jgi:hypothetical protein